MQPPRRHENFNRQQLPASKLRPHHRFESSTNSYSGGSRRGPEVHRTIRRSLSPQGLPQDHLAKSQRIASIGSREYGWHLGGGGRTDRVRRRSRSRSPLLPLTEMRKRWHFEEEDGGLLRNFSPPPPLPAPVSAPVPLELKHRHDTGEAGNYSVNDDLNTSRVYGSEHNDFGISKEELNESRLSAGGKHGTLSQKSIHMEDGAVRGSKSVFIEGDTVQGAYQSPPSLGPVITQGTSGGHLPSSSRTMSIHHSEQERLHYPDPISLDRLPMTETYKEGNIPVFTTMDGFYSRMSGSHSKDIFASSSTGLRNEFQDSYRHDQHMHSLEEFSSSRRKLADSVSMNAYRERSVVDFSRNPDSEQRNLTFYQRGSPTRVEHDDAYFYPKSRGMTFDDRELLSDHLHKVMHPRVLLDYDHSRMGYEHGTVSRSSTMLPVVDRIDSEDYSGNSRKGNMLNNSTLQRHSPSDYHDISRISSASKQGGEHLGSGRTHGKFGRRMSQDYEISHLDAAQVSEMHRHTTNRMQSVRAKLGECEPSDMMLKEAYGYERDANMKFQDRQSPVSKYDSEMHRHTTNRMQSVRDKLGEYEPSDRMLKEAYGYERDANLKFQDRQSPVSKYDSEMHRHTANRMQSVRDKLGEYEPSDRMLKRKYIDEEYRSKHNPRAIVSGKWNTSREFQDLYDNGEEWIDEDIGSSYTSRSARFGHNEYCKDERKYAGLDHYDEFASDDWLPSQDSLAHAQRQSVRYYKPSDLYAKGHQKYGSLSRHKSQHIDIKSGFHKKHRVWKRNDNYLEDVHGGDDNDGEPSENGVSSAAPEPSEDSEEFMQLVHEAFLTYSKQLNMHPGVRRRYMEQGKAGTLFCVVCGRSFSKEFMDTQRLVTHAFMSQKAGLRAQHLGLLKAVCALLGWSTAIPTDIVLWVPQVLPKAEALAQKEDLILWPPLIVIHNISMSDNNPENWKVVSIEALEAFLRGKSLIRGRIKICLGKPADQSVLLVKFLGTFTGLGNAERIHKYFAEQSRGRVDFERAMSNNGKIVEAGMQGESVEERFLYGYMGIVEDLDKVDFNTRNWSLIKSKKEIQDLANAPVKP